MFEPIVEINREKWVLWHFIDDYNVNGSINCILLDDWEKLKKEYDELVDVFPEFSGIHIFTYDELKEMLDNRSEDY